MRRTFRPLQLLAASSLLCALYCGLSVPRASGDEGMWTFDNPPTKLLQQKYGFTPTQGWLDHVRLSSIRFNDGGSGSFISPHGLALTNHHIALDQLQKVSTEQKNYVKDGFLARTPEEEMKCPDLEINVLISMQDVTARVQGAAKSGMSDADGLKARKAEMAAIESESLKATGLRSDVVTLYQGGEYWLYRYKKYTDLRLVFAPEQQMAYFGGDPDNFTYPRYDLDMAIFRAYENGKPADTPNYLRWNSKGAAPGDLVFVSGNPGSTSRLDTVSQVEAQRDYIFPLLLKSWNRQIALLQKYSTQGAEQARQASEQIFFLQNDVKAIGGEEEGLRDKDVQQQIEKREADFKALVNARPEWKQAYGDAWDQIAKAERTFESRYKQSLLWGVRSSDMAGDALLIVRYVVEVKKPDGQRLDGFHDSELESLRFSLFSPAPIYPELEKTMFTDAVRLDIEELGADDPYVKAILNGQTIDQAMQRLFTGTKIADPAFRKSLLDGGKAAVQASSDPMIALARRLDPLGREMRKWQEDDVQSIETQAGEKIGKARFAVYGKDEYPEATFTPRLSYGTVKGYPMNGTIAPPMTTVYGLYDRSAGFSDKPPFDLAARYNERRDELDLATPLDFVSSADIIGGNSGSPVVNRKGELVGLIFDGNIESLIGDFVFDEAKNRAVAVHTAAMMQAMRKLYDAGFLADEIENAATH
jgi:hypothetical protein